MAPTPSMQGDETTNSKDNVSTGLGGDYKTDKD